MTIDQPPPRQHRKWPWIAGIAAAAALATFIGLSAAGFRVGDADTPATSTSTATPDLFDRRTEPDQVLAVAVSKCADQVRLRFADPAAEFDRTAWVITADNPAGTTPPSWRVQGRTTSRTSTRTPLQFLCDVSYEPYSDQYRIALVS